MDLTLPWPILRIDLHAIVDKRWSVWVGYRSECALERDIMDPAEIFHGCAEGGWGS
jgi:hypothetical protein